MNTVTFDTHAAVQELRAADLTEQQAEALVRVLARAVGEPVTKTDFDAAVKDLGTAVNDLDARFNGLDATVKGLGAAVSDLDAKFKGLDETVKDLGVAVRDLDARFKGLDATVKDLDTRFKGFDAAVNDLRARTDVRIAELETRLIKWMVGMTVTLIGVMLAAGTAFVVAILRALE